MNTFQRLVGEGIINYKEANSIQTIDLHTAGEPLRVVLKGLASINGDSILSKRRYCQENIDHYRKALMLEPRGHQDMYGCYLVPPDREDSDLGVLFIHHAGYSTMCGHAIIALTQLFYEKGWKSKDSDGSFNLRFDTPCGQIISRIEPHPSSNPLISFLGVPSFVVGEQRMVDIASRQQLCYQLAYGGAFYAYVDADSENIDLRDMGASEIRDLGMDIKRQVLVADERIVHPLEPDLSFLYGTIFTSGSSKVADSYNVCVFADGEIDRCPTGSGLSGRMAIEYAEGRLKLGEQMSVESISGGIFRGSPAESVVYAGIPAVIPAVSGTAFITGQHQFVLNPEDGLGWGFSI